LEPTDPIAERAPLSAPSLGPSRRRSIFFSYRREDTKLMIAGLVRDLGQRKVLRRVDLFLDLNDIVPGAEWRRVLDTELQRCDVVVALIGPDWLSSRLWEADDMVRWEIATALRRGVPVLPVLADASLPRASELVPDLRDLTAREAYVFNLRTYSTSIAGLADAVTSLLGAQ
jgi:hypothetical protein